MATVVLAVVITLPLAAPVTRAVSQTTVLFDVCAQSATWQRPSPDVQSKVWNDPRYAGAPGTRAYEWTHPFFWSEPDSASISYDKGLLSGLWTEAERKQCAYRGSERGEWIETGPDGFVDAP